jgi:membrane protein implicated in regulation of membrane protease activity
MTSKLRNNGLSLVAAALFVLALAGQAAAGFHVYNQEQRDHHQPETGFGRYLTTGAFYEAVFENWESEFLQMAAFVFLTAFLVQKGSAESRKPDGSATGDGGERDEDPRAHAHEPGVPGPVLRGGLALKAYENSLSLALFGIFVLCFAGHAVGGAAEYSQDQLAHGGRAVSALAYVGTARFWFESFQNWQSEFLSVLAIVLLSVMLRQRGSPESKPVHAPHAATGAE